MSDSDTEARALPSVEMNRMVLVYSFRTWRPLQRKYQTAHVKGTVEAIKLIEGAEIVSDSQQEVPASCLDGNGFVASNSGFGNDT